MNVKNAVKIASEIVVGLGTGAVITNAVKATTPAGGNTYSKVIVFIGSSVISALVASAGTKYVNAEIDAVADQIKDAKAALSEQDN